MCLASDEYTFSITDAYGDGICCSYGNGGYKIIVDGTEVVNGGNFGNSETETFTVNANPTAPSPSAPSPTSPGGGGPCGCGPANGMSQPECVGRSEAQCQHMMNYEGKCSWTVCNPPTPAPVTPTFAPTKEPTKSPTVPEGCYSINFKDCRPAGYEDNDSSCNKIWLPNGAQNNCVAL